MCNNSIEDEKKVFTKIHENYNHLNDMMVDEMEIASIHNVITGDYREQMWIKLFRSIIPKKFSIAQGVMIIDSYGHVSKEIDIAVYDEQYTPYVFQYNTLKFIPIEAVAVVIECKSNNPEIDKVKEWAEKIDELKTKACGIARFATGYTCGLKNPSQKRTRPIKILATIKKSKTDEPLENIKKELEEKFDIIIQQKLNKDTKTNRFELIILNEENTLAWWGKELNCKEEKTELDEGNKPLKLFYINNKDKKEKEEEEKKLRKLCEELCEDCSEKCFNDLDFTKKLIDLRITDNPLLSLNFQLNQLLMLINNPMLFPHYAYANQFNKIIKANPNANTNQG